MNQKYLRMVLLATIAGVALSAPAYGEPSTDCVIEIENDGIEYCDEFVELGQTSQGCYYPTIELWKCTEGAWKYEATMASVGCWTEEGAEEEGDNLREEECEDGIGN